MRSIFTLAVLLLISQGARAEFFACSFTEPFVTLYLSTKYNIATVSSLDPDLEPGQRILGVNENAGVVTLALSTGQRIEINRNKKGSDGMSDRVWPFEGILREADGTPLYGGCEGEHVPAPSAKVEKFVSTHPIGIFGYTDTECQADGGEWNAEYEMCMLEADDEVRLVRSGDSVTLVDILTWGSNAHSCSFTSEKVSVVSDTELIATATAEEYSDPEIAVECKVSLKFSDADTLSVSVDNYETCLSFCGVRASLEVTDAKRKP